MSLSSQDPEQAQLKQLLLACARQDHRALKTLYQHTSAHLFAIVLRIVKNETHAEDCLQQIFVKIWQSAHQYNDDIARPLTWLSTIARNQALDWLRRYKHDRLHDTDEALVEMSDQRQNTEYLAQQWQSSTAVHHCLGTLSHDQRQCLELAYFEGFSHQELSEQLSQPLGTVKTWIRRGLEKLKLCLTQSI